MGNTLDIHGLESKNSFVFAKAFPNSPGVFHSSIVFIFVSGYDLFEYAQKAVKLGAFNYLLKHVKIADLKEVMDSACEKLIYQNKKLEADTLEKIKARQGINQVFSFEDMHLSSAEAVSISFGTKQEMLSCFERCDIHSAAHVIEMNI